MKIPKVVVLLIIIVAIAWLLRDKIFPSSDGSKHVIFGSMNCPWTVKQVKHFEENGKDYTFVDCVEGKCPPEVDGFPTTKTPSGEFVVGFNPNL